MGDEYGHVVEDILRLFLGGIHDIGYFVDNLHLNPRRRGRFLAEHSDHLILHGGLPFRSCRRYSGVLILSIILTRLPLSVQ